MRFFAHRHAKQALVRMTSDNNKYMHMHRKQVEQSACTSSHLISVGGCCAEWSCQTDGTRRSENESFVTVVHTDQHSRVGLTKAHSACRPCSTSLCLQPPILTLTLARAVPTNHCTVTASMSQPLARLLSRAECQDKTGQDEGTGQEIQLL